MNPFLVNVDRLEQEPLELEINVRPEQLELAYPGYDFTEPVTGIVEFSMAGHDVRGVGELRTSASAACPRCLDPVRVPLDVGVDAVWLRQLKDQAERYRPSAESMMAEYYKGDSVDAKNTLRELLLAALPELPYCKPDCKGLCPRCGANLNREACRCPATPPEPERPPEWKEKLLQLRKSTPPN